MQNLKSNIQDVFNALEEIFPLLLDIEKFHTLENTIPKGEISFNVKNSSTSNLTHLGQFLDEFIKQCSLCDIDFFDIKIKQIACFEDMYIYNISLKII